MFKPKPSKPVLFAITFKQISALKGIALVVFLSFVFGIVYVFSATPLTASAATTNTINFQARLETAAGGIVTDGTYNVEFKIYNTLTSSGSSQGSCTGDAHCLWTEDYLVSASQGVAVSNGYMTVNLGSITAFPSTIPWGTPLYLTINIGGTGTPSWDGEMAPRLALTAVPAAFSLESAAGSYTSTLTFQQPTASESIYLPAEAGATNYVCYQNDTNCGFESTTGTNFIQNQNASAQTANYDITGEGQVGTLDAEGTGTANILTIGSSASTTGSIKIANTATSGSVIIGGTATTGTITVGEYDGASTNTIDIGDGATTGTQTINIGAAAGSGGTNNITIGSSTSTSQTKLQAGATTATLTNTEDTIGNTAGSATAFQVQNASGNDVLTVDTTTTNQPQGEVLLGKLSTNNGALAFANSSNGNTLTLTGNTSAAGNDAITLPTAGAVGNLCLQSSSASTASATTLQWGSCGGGGGSTTTLQQAYNNSAGATPNIDVQGTGGSDPYGGVTIQDDNSHGVTTGNNLFSVNAGAGSGLGSTLFGVNTYGDSTITSSDTSGTALNTTGTDISTGDVATFTTPLTGGSIDDLTSGNVVNITSASNAQSSAGALLNVSDTATLATNAGSDTGSLVNISRALTADVSGGTDTPTLDTSGSGPEALDNTSSSATWSFNYTVSSPYSNPFLLVEYWVVGTCASNSTDTMTYNSASMSLIGSTTVTGQGATHCVIFFGKTSPSTGSNTLLITTSSNADGMVVVSDWYNVNQTTPYNTSGNGSFTTATGTTSTASLSASSVPGQVVVDFLDNPTTTTGFITPTSTGQNALATEYDYLSNESNTGGSYMDAASSGNITTMGWSGLTLDAGNYYWSEDSIGLNGSAGGAETVSSPVASISNNCTLTAGTCTDATSVLSLNQQYSNATGNVLNIQDSGSGDAMNVTANSVTSGVGNNQTYNGLTTGDGMDLTTTSAAQSGSGALLNVSDTATLATNSGSDTGDLLNISRSITANIEGVLTPEVDNNISWTQDSGVTYPTVWSSPSDLTINSNVDRYLLVSVLSYGEYDTNAYPSAVSFGSQSMSYLGTITVYNYDNEEEINLSQYGLVAPTAGSSTALHITPAVGDTEYWLATAADYYDVNQTGPIGCGVGSGGSSGDPTQTACSSSGELVVDSAGVYDTTSLTPQSPQTINGSDSDSYIEWAVGSSYRTPAGSSTTMNWTAGSNLGWADLEIDLVGIPGGDGTETVSSPVATISNNCTLTLGTCTDASNLLDLNQQYTNSSGAVLLIQNAGTGDMLDIENGSNVVLDKFSNNGSLTLGQSGGTSTAANVSLLTLGIDTNSTEPSEVNGAMYYNSNLGEFRCGLGGSWVSCINGTVASLVTASSAPSTANFNDTANTVYFTPLYIPGPMTVNSLRIYIANTDSDTGDIGLYNSAGQLVLDAGSGNLSLATTGMKTIAPTQTGSARNLSGGQYYMAITIHTTSSNDPFYSAPLPLGATGVYKYDGSIASVGGLVLPSSVTLSSISAGANLLFMGVSN